MDFRRAGVDDRTRHSLAGCFLVTDQLVGPDHHHFRGVVEMIGFVRINRQVLGQFELKTQQVPHRILILEVRQPAGRRGHLDFTGLFDVIMQSAVDPICNEHSLGLTRLLFVFGGHFPTFEHFEHVLPTLEITSRGQISVQGVKRDLALAFFRTMTPDAILLEKRNDLLFKGRFSLCFGKSRNKQQGKRCHARKEYPDPSARAHFTVLFGPSAKKPRSSQQGARREGKKGESSQGDQREEWFSAGWPNYLDGTINLCIASANESPSRTKNAPLPR